MGKKFVAIRAQGALRADVPVECLPGDAEVAAGYVPNLRARSINDVARW